ncbi:FAD-dependent oxidoreductase [Roseovarius arcticus]|uniref:FAD-dependent oxidoreductase n=1 Tax=Roseovarius arcticus TaxID=2547404 RepID=UPI001110CD01|nr:FAD-dependent oxidoreductase [Roseovarius arcticus]
MRSLETQCVISGGGPAGMMAGYLLARQGVDVIVLEKHADFLRDFRGDTVHPSTLELFHELGLLTGLLTRSYQKIRQVSVTVAGQGFNIADFGRLSTQCKYIAMMPQWDFLDYLAGAARKYPGFKLLQSTKAEDLIYCEGQIVGVRASDKEGSFAIHADLTIGADGRDSTLRNASGLEVKDLGAPIDVFWMRLPRKPTKAPESLGQIGSGGFLVQINRGDYWQCALPFPKGAADVIRAEGLQAFRQRISAIAPELAEATLALTSWDQVKLLTVQVNRLTKWWRDGFLCIGDAAHAMSPVGGVGINLAIQDAVATARLLGPSLLTRSVGPKGLSQVQKRRAWPAKVTQKAQVMAHRFILEPALNTKSPPRPPFFLKLLDKFSVLRGLPARAIGIGLRPEHWREPPHSNSSFG